MTEAMPVISKSVERRLSAQVPEFAEVVRQRDAKEALLVAVEEALAKASGMCARAESDPDSLAKFVRILGEERDSAEADAKRLAAIVARVRELPDRWRGELQSKGGIPDMCRVCRGESADELEAAIKGPE